MVIVGASLLWIFYGNRSNETLENLAQQRLNFYLDISMFYDNFVDLLAD